METESDFDYRGFEFNWICSICLLNARDGFLLESQFIEYVNHPFNVHSHLFFDIDHTPWLVSLCCLLKLHARCVSSLPLAELSIMLPFKCCN